VVDALAVARPGGRLLVSIVLYRTHTGVIEACLHSLRASLAQAQQVGQTLLVLRDHGPAPAGQPDRERWQQSLGEQIPLVYRHAPENPGYGAGHNRTFDEWGKDAGWFLVANADVQFEPDSLGRALAFLRDHPGVGLLAPALLEPEGLRPACFRPPDLPTLALRALGRTARHSSRIARYECRDWAEDRAVFNPPLCSGCCMLFTGAGYAILGGFDPAYFLYFEDFDLSGRAARRGMSAYCPDFRVRHAGGGVGGKPWRHTWWFLRSALRYCRRGGLDRECGKDGT